MSDLKVQVIGGLQSGKSALAKKIVNHLRKDALYGTMLRDHRVTTEADAGPVQVLVETVMADHILSNTELARPVTLAQLKQAFLVWEGQRRAGELQSQEWSDQVPAGQVAEGAAGHLWRLLGN